MPAVEETVTVSGLRDLQRAFKLADVEEARLLRVTLRTVVEPVRADAERFAVAGISRIGLPWSRMRIGVTQSSVYVAPRERGKFSRRNPKLRRPKFAPLLLAQEVRALDVNRPLVVAGVERMLAEVGRKWESV